MDSHKRKQQHQQVCGAKATACSHNKEEEMSAYGTSLVNLDSFGPVFFGVKKYLCRHTQALSRDAAVGKHGGNSSYYVVEPVHVADAQDGAIRVPADD